MEQSNQGVIVLSQSPLEKLQLTFKRLQNEVKPKEIKFKSLFSKQSLLVEAAGATFNGAATGGMLGAIAGTIFTGLSLATGYQVPSFLGPGPLHTARNAAVLIGVDEGISCVMKKLKGKEDVQSRMVTSFSSAAMYSLVSDPTASAVALGLLSALFEGGIFQLRQEKVEDTKYVQARAMLCNLGLHSYEKNFHKGLLTDNTLPLLTDRALREVKIPPGPRLLILDHIQKSCISSENGSSSCSS